MWPYFYAGTMGLVQRDGIKRLRHAMRYSRQHLDDLQRAVRRRLDRRRRGQARRRWARDREVRSDRRLGRQSGLDAGQRDDPYRDGAQGARRKLVVVDPYRTATAEVADLHLMPRPGTDGALACAVMHVLFKEGYADRAYLARYTDDPAELEAHLATRDPAWAAAITGLSGRRDRRLRPALRPHQAQLYPGRLRLLAVAQRRGAALRGEPACRR